MKGGDELKAKAAALRNKGNECIKAKDYEGAMKYYNECVKLDPTDGAAFCNKAMIYNKRDLYDKAIEEAEKAIKANKTFYKAYQRKAEAYLGRHDPKQAYIYIKIVIQKEPANQPVSCSNL